MYRSLALFIIGLLLSTLIASGATAQMSGSYIEYTIKGDAQENQRDEDKIICTKTSENFQAHSMGKWVVTIETESLGVGSQNAKFKVAPPADMKKLRTGGKGDYRFFGHGTIHLQDAGKDKYGMKAVKGSFSAKGLKSDANFTIDIEGKLFCGMF